jgi:exodeoxyribonuclease V alpha subunit
MGCVLKDGDNTDTKILDFKCTPERLVYNSDDFKIYGCSVNSFEYPDVKINKYQNCSLKGNMQELNLGVEYTVKAKEITDKYGVGYHVINIKREKPTTLASTRVFLNEILTQKQADTLLSAYPDIVDRIINDDLDDIDLSKTKWIKEYTFNVIKRKVIENFKLADLVEEFRGLFSLSIIKKIYDKYPSVEKIKEVIRTEPYECLCRLSGIGFKTADGILLQLEQESKECKDKNKTPILFFGFDLKTSYQRAKACVDYLLNENENSGNTYMKVGELKKQFEILVPEAVNNLPAILKGDNNVVFDRESLTVCRKETYATEKYIAAKIKEGLSINTEWDCDYTRFQSLDGFDLTEEQCKTSEYMCKHNLVMLVGYGGAGKSSSTKAFVDMLRCYDKSFLLLAPTGKAAKVLSGFTGEDAMTIHRGLGYMPPSEWQFNKDNPITQDVVIVDEFSMVDVSLFRHLLEAINFNRTKLLLIGDDAQIPSVGAGNVLYDLLCYSKIPTVTLNKIFRYGKGGLSTVATDTRTGTQYLDKTQTGMQSFGEDQSYVFIPMTQDKIVNYTVKLYKMLLDRGYNMEDIAVLSSYNVGDYGTVVLNKKIQDAINPNPDAKIQFGDLEFRTDDIVINITNNYKAILYNEEYIDENNTVFIANGESGKVVKILKNAMVIDYSGTLVYCTKGSMKNVRLGYSISCHRSQGAQYQVVIIITPRSHTYSLNANLLYVGISRAKKQCYHIGEIRTVEYALKKKENFQRHTMLQTFLSQEGESNG